MHTCGVRELRTGIFLDECVDIYVCMRACVLACVRVFVRVCACVHDIVHAPVCMYNVMSIGSHDSDSH